MTYFCALAEAMAQALNPLTSVSGAVSRTANNTNASVAELVDALDSKSCTFGCAGSIPARGTNKKTAVKILRSRFFVVFILALLLTLSSAIFLKARNRMRMRNRSSFCF